MYAHKDYLARRGKPVRIDDLAGHALIGFDKETAFIRSMKTQLPEVRRELLALRTDSDLASLAMLRAGFGIGFCQIGLARRNPDLVRLFPKDIAQARHVARHARRPSRKPELQGRVRGFNQRTGKVRAGGLTRRLAPLHD
jgi:hypothetical protein